MEATGYPKVKSDQYYVFPLEEEVNIGEYKLDALLNSHWTCEKMNVHTPIFISGEELLKHKK